MNTETQNKPEEEVVAEDETTEEETDTTEGTEESTEGESSKEETTDSDEPLQTNIDYKAENEKLKKIIASEAYKYRNQKRQESGEESEDGNDSDDDKPLTRKDLERIQREAEEKAIKTANISRARSIASELTTSEDEAAYAITLWENIPTPFETVEEQMSFVVAGMNHQRLLGKTEELRRSLKSATTARKNTASGTKTAKTTEPSLPGDVKSVLKAQGYTYDSAKKMYTKKLPNGKTLVTDGKGKTQVV